MPRIIIIFLVASALLKACGTARPPAVTFASAWQSRDLRSLEAPNSADSAHDLIAAYARLTETDLEIRVDFLGSPGPFDYDLTLALDSIPGGGGRLPVQTSSAFAWDLAESFPTAGLPRAFTPGGVPSAIRPRILRDGALDMAVIRLSRRDLPADLQNASFQVFITSPGQAQVIDLLGPVQINAPAPSGRANAYLAFWNVLPAATPAQALRRWDGAHTGPFGQRHGLSVLLDQASGLGIPLAVLDLKRPDSLSALDALGGLPRVRQMAKDGLLEISDLLYGDPQASVGSLAITRQAAGDFHLAGSAFIYGSTSVLPADAKAAFARMKETSHLQQWNNYRLAPLPGDGEQVDAEGLSLPFRQTLLTAALSEDPGRVVPLGGSLPDSGWGDSLAGGLAFHYLAGHPWVRVQSSQNLLDLPIQAGAPDCADLLCLAAPDSPGLQQLRQALRESPPGLFTDLAWQAYLALTDPTSDSALRSLRAGYLGNIGPLLAAARWSDNPVDQARCDLAASGNADLRQRTPLCILASTRVFLVIDPLGGRLVLAAARDPAQKTAREVQLIGPRSQFAVGLSDPLDWKPNLGPGGDPQEIPGAFADLPDPYLPYTIETMPGAITFSLPGTDLRKQYRLTDAGFQIQVVSPAPVTTSLPIALIDSGVFVPGGYAHFKAGDNTWTLGSTSIRLSAQGAAFIRQAFNESLPQLRRPEDPDASYPEGHFVPFPLAVYQVQSEGSFTLNVDLAWK